MKTAMNWQDFVDSVRWNIQPFINGKYRPSTSAELFDNIDPSTEKVLCKFAVGNAADVNEAVRVARARFEDGAWSALPARRRADALLKLADLMVQNKDALALLDTLEMGKPIQSALYDAQTYAPALLRYWAEFADKLFGATAPVGSDALLFNFYEPRGVVGAITPWNFPSLNAVYKFAPALAAGNTLVLKPSELAASSTLKLAELALEAGVPEGVLNVVPGLGHTVGSALAEHPGVDMLSFTGSTATGRKVMEICARSNGKPVLLECGGKSPQVVFSDAEDLDAIADAVVVSALANQGQVCGAYTRLIAHAGIKAALLEKVVERARRYRPADPLDEATNFGPLASPAQRARVKNYIDQGFKAGATAALRGEVQETGGCFVSPFVFDRVEPTMSIVREEIFGPVLCVQSFKTESEAIALANSSEYALLATVWTRDVGRARRLARAIRAGYVSIRTSGDEGPHAGDLFSYLCGYEPQKASGFGAELGLKGLESYSTLKAVRFSGA
jgi:acyl-CoA reductase-like NAD-dependent aldehyde dehydrogenase